MKSHLKVKVFSLAAEMKYIHQSEIRWKRKAKFARQRQKQILDQEIRDRIAASIVHAENNFWSLREHRVNLKYEARTSHLAYGFMLGRSYAEMENIAYGPPNWAKIESMIERFSADDPRKTKQNFAEWKADAEAWYEGNEERLQTRINAMVITMCGVEDEHTGTVVTGF